MRKDIFFLLAAVLIACVGLISADITPTDNWNFQDYYNLSSADYVESAHYCNATSCYTITDFLASGSGGATVFTGLTDTPGNYVSQDGKCLTVNETGSEIIFSDCTSGFQTDQNGQLNTTGNATFNNLTITQNVSASWFNGFLNWSNIQNKLISTVNSTWFSITRWKT